MSIQRENPARPDGASATSTNPTPTAPPEGYANSTVSAHQRAHRITVTVTVPAGFTCRVVDR
jgi:hypothetical protein